MNSHMKLLSIFVVHLDAILPTFLEIFSFVHVHHGIDVNSGAEDITSQAFYRWLCSLSTFQMDSLFWSFVVANKLQIVFQKGFFFLTFFFCLWEFVINSNMFVTVQWNVLVYKVREGRVVYWSLSSLLFEKTFIWICPSFDLTIQQQKD